MKKLAYFLISFLALLICTGIGYVYVLYNLSANSIYYAHHMPHAKGTNPELVMAVDNLFWQEEPENKLGITYRSFNDPNEIIVDKLLIYIDYDGEGRYEISRGGVGRPEHYYTDNSGRLKNYWGEKLVSANKEIIEDRPMTNEEKEKVQGWIDETMKPIIASQKKPVINLQQLFNTKYQKRFN